MSCPRHSKVGWDVSVHAAGRYGVWGNWEEPYLTLSAEYEAAQLRVFGRMVAAGHIYRGRKPVHWSPSSRTALAEAVRAALETQIYWPDAGEHAEAAMRML